MFVSCALGKINLVSYLPWLLLAFLGLRPSVDVLCKQHSSSFTLHRGNQSSWMGCMGWEDDKGISHPAIRKKYSLKTREKGEREQKCILIFPSAQKWYRNLRGSAWTKNKVNTYSGPMGPGQARPDYDSAPTRGRFTSAPREARMQDETWGIV